MNVTSTLLRVETTNMHNPSPAKSRTSSRGGVAVIWIDWYPYHIARLRGLQLSPALSDQVTGIEMVGGIGVHAGLKFREPLPPELPVVTLMPDSDWKSAGNWKLARKLWRALGDIQPNTVLIPGYYTLPALAAAAWAKMHGRRSVLMTESTAFDHLRTGWREKLKSLLILTMFDWAVTGGAPHRRYLSQLGFPSDRVVGCYDVVDNGFFNTQATRLRSTHDKPAGLPEQYFLYVGRLSREKNVDGLLDAWRGYRSAGGTWGLVLVGSGAAEGELRRAASESGFGSDVHFAGHKGVSELPSYYARAGCFVLPSMREPWGLVVNEALASSLPVIVSSRCGCAEDLVHSGANGFVFDPHDGTQLEVVLRRIQDASAEERAQMGECSWQIIQRFSPALFGEQIAKIHAERGSTRRFASRGLAEQS